MKTKKKQTQKVKQTVVKKKLLANISFKIYTPEEKKLLEAAHKITNEKTATGAILECFRMLPKRMKELDTFVLQNQQLQFELDDRREAIEKIWEGFKILSKYHEFTLPVATKSKEKNKFGFT